MITACFYRNTQGGIFGFRVEDHADSIVCAAVSALVTNCVNAIAVLTDAEVEYTSEEKAGVITCEVPAMQQSEQNHDADLLFRALHLGLISIEKEYDEHIRVYDEEV